jgi:hypothetical protein
MAKHKKFAVKTYQCRSAILALSLATILVLGFAPAALAQCGGNHSGNMGGQQMMWSSGHMGSSHNMGQYGSTATDQNGQTAATPYATTNTPPASGYGTQDNMGSGSMMGAGSGSSDHSGHIGH